MTVPLDGVIAIHNAFRADMKIIDSAALESARGDTGLEPTLERFRFLNEILVWHAHGEELAVFPAVEALTPLVSEAYLRDHRGLDEAYEALAAAVSARDALETARASAAFKFHLDIHLAKEEAHLYRILRERMPLPEQGKVVGLMSSTVPQDRFQEAVAWMFPLMGIEDRVNMTSIWQMVMPAPFFEMARQGIQKAIGSDYAELKRRIPALQ